MLGAGPELLGFGLQYYLSVACISFYIFYPISSTVIKYRAHYAAKPIQLDEEGAPPDSTTTGNSFIGMFKRVKELEGWRGYYKGSTLTFLTLVAAFVFGTLTASLNRKIYYLFGPRNPVYALITGTLEMIIFMPLKIVIMRGITSPFTVSWHNISSWLHILLTPTERSHPRRLFLNPGLLTCGTLFVVQDTLFLVFLRSAPRMKLNSEIASLVAAPLMILIKTPLSVVFTRLCVQRDRSMDDAERTEEDVAVDAAYSSKEENVVNLRDNEVPYSGFVDCIRQIKAEEGYSTFFRAFEFVLFNAGNISSSYKRPSDIAEMLAGVIEARYWVVYTTQDGSVFGNWPDENVTRNKLRLALQGLLH